MESTYQSPWFEDFSETINRSWDEKISYRFRSCKDFCINSKKHFHCLLCSKVFPYPAHCKRHFEEAHLKRAVVFQNKRCLVCKIDHGKTRNSYSPHYHCPICDNIRVMKRFRSHINDHAEANDIPNECEQQTKRISQKQIIKSQNKALLIKSEQRKKKTVECSICSKRMCAKSLSRHCKNMHQKETIELSYLVDKKMGLYLVRRSFHGVISVPIHVKKNLSRYSDDFGIQCEDKECTDFMNLSWERGQLSVQCKHLQIVDSNAIELEAETLSKNSLEELSMNGLYRMLTKEKIDQCLELHKKAHKACVGLIYSMIENERIVHFSIYTGEIQKYCLFGRICVTANFKSRVLDCRCCNRKVFCVHKCICLWHFVENGTIDSFRNTSLSTSETKSLQNILIDASSSDHIYDTDINIGETCVVILE